VTDHFGRNLTFNPYAAATSPSDAALRKQPRIWIAPPLQLFAPEHFAHIAKDIFLTVDLLFQR
jgi:hypothetical protein